MLNNTFDGVWCLLISVYHKLFNISYTMLNNTFDDL